MKKIILIISFIVIRLPPIVSQELNLEYSKYEYNGETYFIYVPTSDELLDAYMTVSKLYIESEEDLSNIIQENNKHLDRITILDNEIKKLNLQIDSSNDVINESIEIVGDNSDLLTESVGILNRKNLIQAFVGGSFYRNGLESEISIDLDLVLFEAFKINGSLNSSIGYSFGVAYRVFSW